MQTGTQEPPTLSPGPTERRSRTRARSEQPHCAAGVVTPTPSPRTLRACPRIAPDNSACSCARYRRVRRSWPSTDNTSFGANPGHRAQIHCHLVPVLAKRPNALREKVCMLCSRLDDTGPTNERQSPNTLILDEPRSVSRAVPIEKFPEDGQFLFVTRQPFGMRAKGRHVLRGL